MFRINKTKDIDKYIISSEDSISKILINLSIIKGSTLFVCSPVGTCLGSITGGDIREVLARKIPKGEDILKINASNILNQNFIYANQYDSDETIEFLFRQNERIKVIPILNEDKNIIEISNNFITNFKISNKVISYKENFIYIICEIGVNHNGSEKNAFKLVDHASEAGADAIKLQIRSNNLFSLDSTDSFDLSAQISYSEVKRTNLSYKSSRNILNYAKTKGLNVIVTPFDNSALEEVKTWNIDALKIASCDLTNLPLVKNISETGFPVIVSTGMSNESEILKARDILEKSGCNFSFLHCNSTYPSPESDLNLKYIQRLHNLTSRVVGYSSHDGDPLPLYAASTLGARILEFHITQNKLDKGLDHSSSIEVKDLKKVVTDIKKIPEMLGSDMPRKISQGEMVNRVSLSKSLVFSRNLKQGDVIQYSDLELRSPGGGIPYSEINKVIGIKLKSKAKKFQRLNYDLIFNNGHNLNLEKIRTSIKNLVAKGVDIGIPVRFHDFSKFHELIPLEFYEFHMSDSDIRPKDYEYQKISLPKNLNLKKLSVHCVEQFNDGFILDLASKNEEILNRSIKEIENLCSNAVFLQEQLKVQLSTYIILNPGGHSSMAEGPLNDNDALEREYILSKQLNILKKNWPSLTFLLQTMPPFPWHLGGKGHHNILVKEESLNRIFSLTGLKFCFDTSHSFLASNHFGFDFYEFSSNISSKVEHIHCSDAKGSSAEGLQIGHGQIDFNLLMKDYKNQNISLIPEIWQGHEKDGKGFWQALRYLEELI